MVKHLAIPETYIPYLKSICDQRIDALGDATLKIQKELHEIIELKRTIESLEDAAELPEKKGIYNPSWGLTQKVKFVINELGEATLNEIITCILDYEPDNNFTERELNKSVSAIFANNLKAVKKSFNRKQNENNEYVYYLNK